VKIDITPDEYYQRPLEHIQRLYREYLEEAG
jgi:hypothetical protein